MPKVVNTLDNYVARFKCLHPEYIYRTRKVFFYFSGLDLFLITLHRTVQLKKFSQICVYKDLKDFIANQ